ASRWLIWDVHRFWGEFKFLRERAVKFVMQRVSNGVVFGKPFFCVFITGGGSFADPITRFVEVRGDAPARGVDFGDAEHGSLIALTTGFLKPVEGFTSVSGYA